MMRWKAALAAASISAAAPAFAAETITYSYDAHGRLAQVVRTGTVNNGVTASYAFDKADNRTAKTVTGALSPMIVVPLAGFTLIPIHSS